MRRSCFTCSGNFKYSKVFRIHHDVSITAVRRTDRIKRFRQKWIITICLWKGKLVKRSLEVLVMLRQPLSNLFKLISQWFLSSDFSSWEKWMLRIRNNKRNNFGGDHKLGQQFFMLRIRDHRRNNLGGDHKLGHQIFYHQNISSAPTLFTYSCHLIAKLSLWSNFQETNQNIFCIDYYSVVQEYVFNKKWTSASLRKQHGAQRLPRSLWSLRSFILVFFWEPTSIKNFNE